MVGTLRFAHSTSSIEKLRVYIGNMKKMFKPSWWLSNRHVQTIWATCFRKRNISLLLRHEKFDLKDGDFLDLVWYEKGKGPIVILLHGLEGSANSPYALGMLETIQQLGWRGVVMQFRCCGHEINRLPRSYHAGDTADLAEFVYFLKEKEPATPLLAVGFSLGGNVLLKWLGETKKDNPLQAAVAVSVPFDLGCVAEQMQKGLTKLYQAYFLKLLRQKMTKKMRELSIPFYFPSLKKLKTIYDFDDYITAPLHGFKNAEDYYQQSSSKQFLKSIEVPTLMIHAKDDPFMTPDILPSKEELSQKITFEIYNQGGHVGFVTGKFPWRINYWLEQRIPLFLQEFIVTNEIL